MEISIGAHLLDPLALVPSLLPDRSKSRMLDQRGSPPSKRQLKSLYAPVRLRPDSG